MSSKQHGKNGGNGFVDRTGLGVLRGGRVHVPDKVMAIEMGKKKARIKIQPVLNPISYEKPKV